MAPLTALQMVANGAFESVATGGGARRLGDAQALGCALGAGAISALLYTPVDMTMIQQQKLGLGPAATVRALVADGCDVGARDEKGQRALHDACAAVRGCQE